MILPTDGLRFAVVVEQLIVDDISVICFHTRGSMLQSCFSLCVNSVSVLLNDVSLCQKFDVPFQIRTFFFY